MMICVYTDGACPSNGYKAARAGIGIFFGINDPRNCSEVVEGDKQTNNVAELTAILRAEEILHLEIVKGAIVTIYSDSKYAIRCCGEYGKKLAGLNWKKKKPIPNLLLVKRAYDTFSTLSNVKFQYVPAHTGKKDVHSVGNAWADYLANKALGISVADPSKQRNETVSKVKDIDDVIFLNVPYKDKDDAKKLGAKWNPKKKAWYFKKSLTESKQAELQSKWGGDPAE